MHIFLDNRNYIRCVCEKKVDIPILWSGSFFGRLKISWSESHREWREVRESEGRWVGGLNPPLPSPPLPSPPLFFRRASLVLFPTAGAWLQVKMFSVRQPRIWNLIFWRIIFYFWWNVGEKTKKKNVFCKYRNCLGLQISWGVSYEMIIRDSLLPYVLNVIGLVHPVWSSQWK